MTVPQRLALLPLVAVVGAVGASYASVLRAPGYATIDVRTVDWLKGHGFTSAVDRAEAWWLWKHPPSTKDTLTSLAAPPRPRAQAHEPVTTGERSTTDKRSTTGERFTTDERSHHRTARRPGSPHALGAVRRPADPQPRSPARANGPQSRPRRTVGSRSRRRGSGRPAHPDLTVSLAWMDPATVRFMLIAGTRQPGGGSGPAGAQVPADLQSQRARRIQLRLQERDTPGGALEEGHMAGTLQDGIASFVVHTDGSATVGMWGRDVQLGPDVTGVRQNLHLIIDGGRWCLVCGTTWAGSGVASAAPSRRGVQPWVSTRRGMCSTERNQLTLDVLAEALHSAGAVRAMELDIHKKMVEFNLFTHPAGQAAPVGHRLSPDMPTPAGRYLFPDQRDFVAVFSR